MLDRDDSPVPLAKVREDDIGVVGTRVVDEDDFVVDVDGTERLGHALVHDGDGACVIVASDHRRQAAGPRERDELRRSGLPAGPLDPRDGLEKARANVRARFPPE